MLNFKKITFKKALILAETIAFHKTHDIEHIENYYLNRATDFSDNLSFLSAIHLVEVSDGKIIASAIVNSLMSKKNEKERNNKLKLVFLENMIQDNDNAQIQDFWDYCSKFLLEGEKLTYLPNLTNRLKRAGIRNFLMELGFVKRDSDKNEYFIDRKYADLFTRLRQSTTTLSPQALDSMQKKQIELGTNAELKIIEYEMEKLKGHPNLSKKIQHVAKTNVNAGYDIESFCEVEAKKGVSEKIYIEVKAVSAIKKRFFWSSNEVDTAKRLKLRYYLYLLPIGMSGQFNIGNLQIIQNPYESVYLSSDWLKKEESITVTEKI